MENKFELNFGSTPERDWQIIFISTLILLIVSIAVSTFVYLKVSSGEVSQDPKNNNAEINLDIEKVKSSASIYRDKALQFEKIQTEKISSVDPSI